MPSRTSTLLTAPAATIVSSQLRAGRVGDVEDIHLTGLGIDYEQPLGERVVGDDLGRAGVEDASGVRADGHQRNPVNGR